MEDASAMLGAKRTCTDDERGRKVSSSPAARILVSGSESHMVGKGQLGQRTFQWTSWRPWRDCSCAPCTTAAPYAKSYFVKRWDKRWDKTLGEVKKMEAQGGTRRDTTHRNENARCRKRSQSTIPRMTATMSSSSASCFAVDASPVTVMAVVSGNDPIG